MASSFSRPSNAKYLVSLQILINPSILSNLICKGFASFKFLYEMS